jgi:hypothetical protein
LFQPKPGTIAFGVSHWARTTAPASAAASDPFWTIRCYAHAFPPSMMSPTITITASMPPTMMTSA